MYMAKAHKFAGDWLRGIKQPNGARVKLAPGQIHPHFTKLASNLRAAYAKAEELRTRATNRIGPILPPARPRSCTAIRAPPVGADRPVASSFRVRV